MGGLTNSRWRQWVEGKEKMEGMGRYSCSVKTISVMFIFLQEEYQSTDIL